MSERMTLRDIAAAAEIEHSTARRLQADARKARSNGTATDRTLPEPIDTAEGGTLVWRKSDVLQWLRARRQPARRGAVPKQVLHESIAMLEQGNVTGSIELMRGALQ